LELLAEIDLGGSGEFFHGRDTRSGQEVGVQILPFARGVPLRFEAAQHRAAQLNHPNILAIRGLRAKVDISYIVTEPFDGESLAAILKHGPLAITEAVDFADQIAQALDAAHAADVVHGNLGPPSLLVDRAGNIKVFGFSIAKPRAEDEEEGRYEYFSPEALRGQPIDARSDIFSFGSTLYEMLAGYPPFRRHTPAETVHAVMEEWAEGLPAKIPDDLADVVARCLQKDPEDRFQSAGELNAALRNLVVQSLADPVTELSPQTRRLQGLLHFAVAQLQQAAHRLAAGAARLTQLQGWPAMVLALLVLLLAADLFLRVRATRSPPVPSFQRLTFRQGPIIRARLADRGREVVYTARFEGAPQASFLTTADTGAVRDLKLPPDSSIVAISRKGDLAVRMKDGSLARLPINGGDLINQAASVLDADFSPSGDAIAVAHYDSVAANFALEYPVGHILVQSPEPIDLVRVSRDGEGVAFSRVEGARRRLWFVKRSGGAARMLADLGPGAENRSLAWSKDGTEIWFGATSAAERGIIHAIALDGQRRVVDWLPEAELDDVGENGEALVETFRTWSGTRLRGLSDSRDTDLSWFGESVNAALPADGSQVFSTEHGAANGRLSGVYRRSRRGTPPQRLCDGSLVAVSPDGKWVSVYRPSPQPRYFLVPANGGQEQPVDLRGLEGQTAAVIAWLPGNRYLVWGNRPRDGKQHFVWDPAKGKLQAVSPPGSTIGLASDDGSRLLTGSPSGSLYVLAVDGSRASPALGLLPGDQLLRWSSDKTAVFAGSAEENRRDFAIYKIYVANGARTLWKRVEPDVPADSSTLAAITPDGNTYAYIHFRAQSELFLARGLK
jgi:WD40 repeat protein